MEILGLAVALELAFAVQGVQEVLADVLLADDGEAARFFAEVCYSVEKGWHRVP